VGRRVQTIKNAVECLQCRGAEGMYRGEGTIRRGRERFGRESDRMRKTLKRLAVQAQRSQHSAAAATSARNSSVSTLSRVSWPRVRALPAKSWLRAARAQQCEKVQKLPETSSGGLENNVRVETNAAKCIDSGRAILVDVCKNPPEQQNIRIPL